MMKKTLIMLGMAASLAMFADEPKQPAKPAAPQQPAKPAAPECDQQDQPGNPDQKQVKQEQRRRYEIMVLLQAYRITPEDQSALRDQLKTAIVGRLKADFEANKEQRKNQIQQIEKRLNELKALDGQSADEQINKEFDRLVNAPINGIGPRGWIGGDKQGKGGPDGDDCDQGGRDKQGNFGGGRFGGQQPGQQRGNHPMLNRFLNQQQPQGEQPPPPPQGEQPPPAPAVAQ